MRTTALLATSIVTSAIIAQEKLGIANSNYYPAASIFLNPSSSVDNRVFVQFGLTGVNAFAKTNAGYLPHFSFWKMRSIGSPELSDTRTQKFLYATATVEGPSMIISQGRFSGGFFMRGNTIVNVRRIPYEVPGFLMGQMPSVQQGTFAARNAGFSNMSWLEYGVNFGMMVKGGRTDLLTAGINLKYINGINIFYANLDQFYGYYTQDMMRLDTVAGRARYTSSAVGSGKGFAADLGVTYKKTFSSTEKYWAHSPKSNCRFIDYRYKLALSLRDLGYVRFANGTLADLQGSGNFSSSSANDSYQSYMRSVVNTTFAPGAITAFMPASVSGQFDYNFDNYVYVSATVVKNVLPNKMVGVQRADLLSICPRYEFQYFEVAMPVTLHRFIYPQLGLAFRVRSLVIGLDNMLPLIIAKDTWGLGAYFQLAYTLFRNPACRTFSPRVADCAPKMRSGGNYRRQGFLKRLFRFGKTHSR